MGGALFIYSVVSVYKLYMLIILDKNEYNYTKNNEYAPFSGFWFDKKEVCTQLKFQIQNDTKFFRNSLFFRIRRSIVKSIFDGGVSILEVRDCSHRLRKFWICIGYWSKITFLMDQLKKIQ